MVVTLALTLVVARGAGDAPPARWNNSVLRQPSEWYASAAARAIADSVLQYQSTHGGWPKNVDLSTPPASPEAAAALSRNEQATIDNGATTTPLRFLALMVQATGEPRYRAAVERGIDYLLGAQYPNGGWPQYYPLRDGYYSRITFNDNAMVNVLTLLRDAAAPAAPFAFVDKERRSRATGAVARGIDCMLRTQIVRDGQLTAWCAQHDETTLAPAWARNYEPPTLSGAESVGIVRFLMAIEQPTPEIVAAVEGAVAWFRAVAIHGVRLESFTDAAGKRDRRVVEDAAADPIWARFYELGTHRPVFTGRDRVPRYALAEIEYERRNGYAYYGTWPAPLLASEVPAWRVREGRPTASCPAHGRGRVALRSAGLHLPRE
jgi:PelA/Pel-15E family pectate lyase